MDDRGAARRSLAALSLLLAVVTAGTFASLGVALPDMVASQRWSWSQAGLGFTLLGLACGLASLAPAVIIRTLGVRATLLAGGALLAAGFACAAGARDVGLFWLGATLQGLGYAFAALIPGTFVLARRFSRPARAFGVYYMAGGLGGVAGPWVYAWTAGPSHDWRLYWGGLALAVLGASALASWAIGPIGGRGATGAAQRDETSGEGWSLRAALATPQFWIVTLAYTAYLLAETVVSSLSVAHLTRQGVAAGVAGGMLSLQALLNAVSRLGGGALGARFGARRVAAGALALMAVGMGALAVARDWPAMIVYAVAVGVGYGVSFLATTVLLLEWFGRRRNLELFSTLCLVSTLAAVGPVAGGWSRDHLGSFAPALWACAGLALALSLAVALTPAPQMRTKA